MLSASPNNVGMTGRILIIDDDLRLAELVSDYLGEAGFRASVSTTAGQGVERLKREAFDALVLDLMLPDADGTSLGEWVPPGQVTTETRARAENRQPNP